MPLAAALSAATTGLVASSVFSKAWSAAGPLGAFSPLSPPKALQELL